MENVREYSYYSLVADSVVSGSNWLSDRVVSGSKYIYGSIVSNVIKNEVVQGMAIIYFSSLACAFMFVMFPAFFALLGYIVVVTFILNRVLDNIII